MAAQSEEMEVDQVVEEVDEKVVGEETRDEPPEEEEAEGEEGDEVEDEREEEPEGGDQPGEKKRSRNPPKPLVREPGKSVLPFARVQKIIKADRVRFSLRDGARWRAHTFVAGHTDGGKGRGVFDIDCDRGVY